MPFECLDTVTATAFQVSHGSALTLNDESYSTLFKFSISGCEALDTHHNADNLLYTNKSKTEKFRFSNKIVNRPNYYLIVNCSKTCRLRKGDHNIYNCFTFL